MSMIFQKYGVNKWSLKNLLISNKECIFWWHLSISNSRYAINTTFFFINNYNWSSQNRSFWPSTLNKSRILELIIIVYSKLFGIIKNSSKKIYCFWLTQQRRQHIKKLDALTFWFVRRKKKELQILVPCVTNWYYCLLRSETNIKDLLSLFMF